MRGAERGLIVCGPELSTAFSGPVTALAGVLGWPVLADPLSQVRCGPHDRSMVVDSYDAFLRDTDTVAASVSAGGGAAVRRAADVEDAGRISWRAVGRGRCSWWKGDGWSDPSLTVERAVRSDPSVFCDAVLGLLAGALGRRETDDGVGGAVAGDRARQHGRRWWNILRRTGR